MSLTTWCQQASNDDRNNQLRSNWEYEADPDLPQLDVPEDITIAESYAADQKNRLNFLFDPDNEVSITADELNDCFGTKKSTVSNKAGMIELAAHLYLGDPEFGSAKITDMFRFYETEQGFVFPGSFLDSLGY